MEAQINGEESHVNKTQDGCTYPGYKLAQFTTVSEKHNVNKTRLLKPGTGAGHWWVMEPHLIKWLFKICKFVSWDNIVFFTDLLNQVAVNLFEFF